MIIFVMDIIVMERSRPHVIVLTAHYIIKYTKEAHLMITKITVSHISVKPTSQAKTNAKQT